jgi:N-acetylneuraminic acid mutarotase
MGSGRFVGTATLLTNGQVLVAGGGGNPLFQFVASAEIYDPATRAWSFVGSMSVARISHSAVLLPNGKVLVAGGSDTNDNNLASAELYDPSTRAWTITGSMAVGRYNHEATTLRNGKVLVAGGFDEAGDPLLSAELYDPKLSWVAPSDTTQPRPVGPGRGQ